MYNILETLKPCMDNCVYAWFCFFIALEYIIIPKLNIRKGV